MNEGGDEPPPAQAPKACQPVPRLRTSMKKKERKEIVVGNSLLRGTEASVCRPDASHRRSAACLGHRLETFLRGSQISYDKLTVTCCWLCRSGAMEQCTGVQKQSGKTSGPWGDFLRVQSSRHDLFNHSSDSK